MEPSVTGDDSLAQRIDKRFHGLEFGRHGKKLPVPVCPVDEYATAGAWLLIRQKSQLED